MEARLLTLSLLVLWRASAGDVVESQQAAQAAWDQTFTNLPDAVVGEAYSVDLSDYGDNIDQFVDTLTTRGPTESIWPTGLSLDRSTGVLSGAPTVANEVVVVDVIGINGSFDEAADWNARTALSGVVVAHSFETREDVEDRYVHRTGMTHGRTDGSSNDRTWFDESVSLYGSASMRQEILDTDKSPNNSAAWRSILLGGTLDRPTMLDVGEEATYTYSVMFDRAGAQWAFAANRGRTKHHIKVSIVDEINTADFGELSLDTNWGSFFLRIGQTPGKRIHQGLSTACNRRDVQRNNLSDEGAKPLTGFDPGLPSGKGAGRKWAACQQDRARYGQLQSYDSTGKPINEDGFPDPLIQSWRMLPDWWVSHCVHVKRLDSSDIAVRVWWAPLGQDWIPVGENLSADKSQNLGVINLLSQHSEMDAEEGVRPSPIERWYDGLIVRTGDTCPPAPGVTLGGLTSAMTKFGIRTVSP